MTMNQPITNIVENADGSVTFDYCLDGVADAISSPHASSAPDFEIDGPVIRARARTKVYSMAGVLLMQIGKHGEAVLSPGTYLVRSEGATKKILVR